MNNPTIAAKILLAALVLTILPNGAWAENWDGEISQFGKVQETLGERHHQGRGELSQLLEKPNCYAVGSLARLAGEVTIADGQVIATRVTSGKPVTVSGEAKDHKAASIVAMYVPKWIERKIEQDLAPKDLERFVHAAATEAGIDSSKPFPFMIEGKLTQLEMHVINGACPMRAKRLGEKLPEELKPYQGSYDEVAGKLIGLYAEGSVGSLTCRGSQAHTHVLLKDDEGRTYTGHVEGVGVAAGAVLSLPVK